MDNMLKIYNLCNSWIMQRPPPRLGVVTVAESVEAASMWRHPDEIGWVTMDPDWFRALNLVKIALLIHSRIHNMCMHTKLEFNWSYCVILGGTRAESERLGRHDENVLVDDGDFLLNWTFVPAWIFYFWKQKWAAVRDSCHMSLSKLKNPRRKYPN